MILKNNINSLTLNSRTMTALEKNINVLKNLERIIDLTPTACNIARSTGFKKELSSHIKDLENVFKEMQ